jgi:hypothetical protein
MIEYFSLLTTQYSLLLLMMYEYPEIARIENLPELIRVQEVSVFAGGFGSSLAADPNSQEHFYLLADRGPVLKGEDKIQFVYPEYCPSIGRFKLEGEELILVNRIELKNKEGKKLSGLPRPQGEGNTGEKIYDLNDNPLDYDPDGIDPEGLTVMPDGTFWIAEEYEPALLHFNQQGILIEKISPYTQMRKLPQVLKNRKKNRGFEGITHTPDGKKIVAIMQSTLHNPERTVQEHSRLCRLITYEPVSGTIQQFAYMLEEPMLSCSEITFINNKEFLLIERDGKPAKEAHYKRVYKIDLSNATDLSDPDDNPQGLLFEGKTLEQLSARELVKHNIQPVSKELVVDLLQKAYPHEKPEGIALIDNGMLAISNDDDYGIEGDIQSGIKQKFRTGSQEIAHSEIYFISIE